MNMLYWNFVLSYTNTVGIDCLQLYKGNYKLPELNILEFYPPLFNLLRCPISNIVMYKDKKKETLHENCPNTELFLVRIFLYSV